MRKALKWIGIIFGAIIVLGVVVTALDGGEDEPLETNDAQPATAQPESKEEPKEEAAPAEEKEEAPAEEPKEDTGISKEDYDSITVGDPLSGDGGTDKQTVLDMFGKESSQMDVSSGEYSSTTYTWMDADFNAVTVTFTNDKVSSKLWSE